jgi:glycerol-3-phosphate cytidylyltransferase
MKYKIGYTTGTFDLFHVGHLNIIKKAKSLCDYLIVGVSTDENVRRYKGKSPVICYEDRVEIIKALSYVDQVVPQVNLDKYAQWQLLGFDAYFIGDDWKDNKEFMVKVDQLASVGVDTVFFTYTKRISSSIIKEEIVKGTNRKDND